MPIKYYPYFYPLFKHMSDNHGLTLLDSELDEICRAVDATRGTVCRDGDTCYLRSKEMKAKRKKK